MSGKTSKALWRDHLPELAIKQLYGKFSLVSNETVIPEFNVEKKIDIPKTFTLSKGRLSYHFELVQSDANSKVSYEAVVKHPAFPLKEDTECRLDMTYQYGAEEPYKLLFIPISKETPFIEAKVSWERIVEYPYDNLNAPSFIPYLPWSEMYKYRGEKNVQNLIEEFVYKLNEINKGYSCIDLNKCDRSVTGENEKRRLVIQENYNGEPATIIFSENDKDKTKNNMFSIDRPDIVSFELQAVSNQNNGQRYKVNLRDYVWYDNIWINKGNGYACYPIIPINNTRSKIAFFENAFDEPGDFSPGIQYVSFEVVPYKDMYKAVNIHDESKGEYIRRKVYFARHIRNGNSPSQFLYNGRFHFLMITLFTGKKYITDNDCPLELKETFNNSKYNWLRMFLNCDDDWKKMRIFNLLSLVSTDIGEKAITVNRIKTYAAICRVSFKQAINFLEMDCTYVYLQN